MVTGLCGNPASIIACLCFKAVIKEPFNSFNVNRGGCIQSFIASVNAVIGPTGISCSGFRQGN